jgi:hypothetical protein
MLGIERGNADLLVFAIVVGAVLVFGRGRAGAVGAFGLLLAAAVLKLFPVFGFAAAARRPRARIVVPAVAALALFAAYADATRDDIRTIQHVVPQSRDYSYGVDISGRWLATHLPGSRHAWDAVLVLAMLIVAVGAGAIARARRPPAATFARETYAYWVGTGIYIGTFLLARNFDYRLVFLLLTLPQLLAWRPHRSVLTGATVAAIAATVWFIHGPALAVGAPAQLLACALLGAGLVASLDWRGLTALRSRARCP